MPDVLLARYADCIFWLARYIERAENLARILDVNETFSRDSRGGQNWRSIVQLNSDEERFFASHDTASAHNVVNFYVIDGDNPTSIVSAIRCARENARTLRPLISTEMWVQLNVFYNRLAALSAADLAPGNLAALFAMIKEACQTHTGITEGTFFRDQGWYFYQIGRYIERADQTTRLLDIKYHLLLPEHFRCRITGRCQPMECAAAFGSRVSRVSAAACRQHDAGARGGLYAAEQRIPALGPSLRARGRPAARRGQIAPWSAQRQRCGRGARPLAGRCSARSTSRRS